MRCAALIVVVAGTLALGAAAGAAVFGGITDRYQNGIVRGQLLVR